MLALRLDNENKIYFSFHYARLALTLFHEVRLRLGNKNKKPLAFYFVLLSPCTNFAPKYKVK